jgi:iron-sulfur cluster assembly protein
MSYTMDLADSVQKGDEVVDVNGLKVLIDPKAVLFLLGTTMDFTVDKMSAKFVFKNPNETSACGCGESVTIVPAKAEHAH